MVWSGCNLESPELQSPGREMGQGRLGFEFFPSEPGIFKRLVNSRMPLVGIARVCRVGPTDPLIRHYLANNDAMRIAGPAFAVIGCAERQD